VSDETRSDISLFKEMWPNSQLKVIELPTFFDTDFAKLTDPMDRWLAKNLANHKIKMILHAEHLASPPMTERRKYENVSG